MMLVTNSKGKQIEVGPKMDLRGTILCEANLAKTTFSNVNIDGAMVRPEDVGGPGHILCALTDEEWEWVQQGRDNKEKES